MNIGKQIKALRTRRGVTQEDLANRLGVTAQAVSKWENGVASPDIALLPEISVYFGVTIDELFALSDEVRMERIQNMLWDVRFLSDADVRTSRAFLLDKAEREPQNGRPHELLADLENHLAKAHHDQAAEHAKEALRRDPTRLEAHSELVEAMGGKCFDWGYSNHQLLISWQKSYLAEHPRDWHAAIWLIDQLVDDYRFTEAKKVLQDLSAWHDSYRCENYRGVILWHEGRREEAFAVWTALMEKEPDIWTIPDTIGDYLARSERWDEAIAAYRRAIETAKAPRYVDPWVSMARVYEIKGEMDAAIAILEEELDVLKDEWNCKPGEETYDEVVREIERLRK